MEKRKRPGSVTMVAIILSMYGIYLTIPAYYELVQYSYRPGRRSFDAKEVLEEISSLWVALIGTVNLISGIVIFRGRNWGRRLYLYFMPVAIFLDWLIFGCRGSLYPELVASVIVYMTFFAVQKIPEVSSFFE